MELLHSYSGQNAFNHRPPNSDLFLCTVFSIYRSNVPTSKPESPKTPLITPPMLPRPVFVPAALLLVAAAVEDVPDAGVVAVVAPEVVEAVEDPAAVLDPAELVPEAVPEVLKGIVVAPETDCEKSE